ncbi:MAG: MFS transporter [Beijerinckiaceae bacterium]|nr:MAG: MFS transporter [Beijerinckiaceae bacterium]
MEQATYWRLCGLSAALFLPYGLHLPYFPVWLAARGLTDFQIAATLATPLILRVLLMPVIAYVADRRGIAVTLAWCASTMAACYVCLGFLPGIPLVFAVSVVAITAQGSMPALSDALALAEIRRFQKIGLRGIQYGRIRVGASLSVLVMMLLSGPIVAVFPGRKIIFALALLGIVPVIASVRIARRMRKVRFHHGARSGLTEDPRALPLAILVIAAASLVQASHAEIYAFGTLQWAAAGFGHQTISLAWAIGVMSESVLLIFCGRYIRGVPQALAFLLLGGVGASLRWIAMSLAPDAKIVLGLQVLHALSFAATYLGSVSVLGWLAGPNHRARMQGWLSAASALSMALATIACGRLTHMFGAGAYLAMAGLAAVGTGLACAAIFMQGFRKLEMNSV